ncbi:MAG TPA: hypothetical protein VNP71_04455 [Thermoplasmata archaeon]|nr:hypothetical protein [Thermoplasmata archaeon]
MATLMARSKVLLVEYVDDETWRIELCPDCGARLIGFAAWEDHGPRHAWGPEWLAARVRAGRPGEIIRVDPSVVSAASDSLAVEAVEDARWKSGIPV